jgi:hypothetical protein
MCWYKVTKNEKRNQQTNKQDDRRQREKERQKGYEECLSGREKNERSSD